MRYAAAMLCSMTLFAAAAAAGELFGSISDGDKPIAAGVKVEVVTPEKTYSAETDKSGAYRIYVKEKGKCSLRLAYKNQTPSTDVVSFEKSTRYDFVLETKDGKYTLRRK